MRLRMLLRPYETIDGVELGHLVVGGIYDLRNQIASVLLAEGCAEIVSDDTGVPFLRPTPSPFAHIRPSVLVVDDEPEIRQLTESLLISHGYHVVVAGDGKDALERLRERCPDLIVLDLAMPVMDGWEFRTEQRYLPDIRLKVVPVVILSAADNAAAQARTLEAAGVVKKPFDPDDLLEAVSAAIGLHGSAPDGVRSTRPRKTRRG